MSKFSERLRARGRVEEDLYFVKRDRELLEAMKRDELAKALDLKGKKEKKSCDDIEDDFDRVSKQFRNKHGKLARAYHELLKRAHNLLKKARKR